MAKDFAKQFYKSKKWLDCRNSFIQSRIMIDGGVCQHCGKRLGYIVHHKELLTEHNINNPMISLNHELLEYVCKECHDKEHYLEINGKEKEKINYMFDENGDYVNLGMPPIK